MKRVLLHGALALLGLGLAWRASRPSEEASAGTSTERLFDCAASGVTRLEWRAEHDRVEIVPDVESGYRVTHETTPQGSGSSDDEVTQKQYRGLRAVKDLLEQLAPLESSRDLGEVDAAQLTELGLDADAAQLTLACGDTSQVFHVGDSAYGSGKRYLQRAEGGHVYLVSAEAFRALAAADGRLMQRDLHAFEGTQVERVEVSAYGANRSLLQRGRQNPRAARWVDAEDSERVNELYGNWLRDVGRLRAQRYLGEGVEPGAADAESSPEAPAPRATPQPVVSLRYLDDQGDELGHTELVRVAGEPERYFARSEATVVWVEVPASVATSVARDAAAVVGAQAPLEAEPAPAPPAGPTSPAN